MQNHASGMGNRYPPVKCTENTSGDTTPGDITSGNIERSIYDTDTYRLERMLDRAVAEEP